MAKEDVAPRDCPCVELGQQFPFDFRPWSPDLAFEPAKYRSELVAEFLTDARPQAWRGFLSTLGVKPHLAEPRAGMHTLCAMRLTTVGDVAVRATALDDGAREILASHETPPAETPAWRQVRPEGRELPRGSADPSAQNESKDFDDQHGPACTVRGPVRQGRHRVSP